MLILSRREGERIVVDAGTWQIEVQVLRAGNGRVRLGVVAPRNIAVHRQEVWERIRQWREPDSEALQAQPAPDKNASGKA